MFSRLSPVVRARLAVAMIAVCALTSVRLPVRFVKQLLRKPEGNENVRFVARVEPLRDRLPPGVPLGYISRPGADCSVNLRQNRQGLLQYALAPQWLDATGPEQHEYLLFDADDPEQTPDANGRKLELVADAHNGLKLFRNTQTR